MRLNPDKIKVSDKLDQTVQDALSQVKQEARRARRKKLFITCGSMAAAFAAAAVFCVTNPSLAAKLPFIGSLFSDLEDNFTYPGDYSGHASVLTPTTDAVPETAAESQTSADSEAPAENPYSVSDHGVTLTASEIYSDGLSVFLTMEVHIEEAMGWHYQYDEDGNLLRNEDGSLVKQGEDVPFYLDPTVSLDGTAPSNGDSSYTRQINDHTYHVIMKYDLDSDLLAASASHTLNWSTRSIGADFSDSEGNPVLNEANPLDASFWVRGTWTLSLPFTVESGVVKTYDGLNPDNQILAPTTVKVSPYQVQILYTPGQDEDGDPEGTMVVFDQDGTLLPLNNDTEAFGLSSHSLNGTVPTELHIYGIEYWIDGHKIRTEETAKEKAVTSLTLSLD